MLNVRKNAALIFEHIDLKEADVDDVDEYIKKDIELNLDDYQILQFFLMLLLPNNENLFLHQKIKSRYSFPILKTVFQENKQKLQLIL